MSHSQKRGTEMARIFVKDVISEGEQMRVDIRVEAEDDHFDFGMLAATSSAENAMSEVQDRLVALFETLAQQMREKGLDRT